MAKRKKSVKHAKVVPVVTTETVVTDLCEKVKCLRDDLSRCLGVLQSVTPGDPPERTLHKLQSVVGRTRPFIRRSTVLAGLLSLLGRHVATLE